MFRAILLFGLLALAAPSHAQNQKFAYPSAAPNQFIASRNVTFGSVEGTILQMDVFRPVEPRPAPALIFSFLATGDERTASADGFYKWWAELAASRGIVGILADLRMATAGPETATLLDHLTRNAEQYGIDPERIAIYGASANASRVLPFVENSKETRIKSAVIYYRDAHIKQFRLDLPVLFVRAGLDRPMLNRDIVTLASTAIAQNAPLTLLNHPSGYHGFEIFNHDDATREVIDRTLQFVKDTTEPAYETALRLGMPEATAAGYVASGDYAAAAFAYAALVAKNPDNARLGLSYGEALLGDKQYTARLHPI